MLTEDYHQLYQYSIEHDEFWIDLWEFLGIVSSVPPNKVRKVVHLERRIASQSRSQERITAPGRIGEIPIWFPNARLNYAENLLWRKDDAIAITATGETGAIENYTFRQLREMVRKMASALRISGLRVGDRVAGMFTATRT